MRTLAKELAQVLPALFLTVAIALGAVRDCSAQDLTLYTPYTQISVSPGQTITYPVDLINKDKVTRTADLEVRGLPRQWGRDIKAGAWTIDQIAVLPGEKKSFTLDVQVPLLVNKGTYHFLLSSGGANPLPLSVIVSKQGTSQTEFSVDQDNLVGAAKSTFTFNAKLQNSTDETQVYALASMADPGWQVAFKANYKQVASVSVDPNHTQNVTIEVTPPDQIGAGTYKIPVAAATGSTSASLVLQVGVTGSYGLQLTTPTGLLSTSVTAGSDKRVELALKNTGSAALKNISMQFAAPTNWDVSFDPKTIDDLAPGQTAQVFATIKTDDKAIAGDYMTNLTARTQETSATAQFRVSVGTSLLWSWSGILIILAALGAVYYLFRKYGRR